MASVFFLLTYLSHWRLNQNNFWLPFSQSQKTTKKKKGKEKKERERSNPSENSSLQFQSNVTTQIYLSYYYLVSFSSMWTLILIAEKMFAYIAFSFKSLVHNIHKALLIPPWLAVGNSLCVIACITPCWLSKNEFNALHPLHKSNFLEYLIQFIQKERRNF